jgi:hypothetical protein
MTRTTLAGQLAAVARLLVERPDPESAGLWPRAAALLARQSIETSLEALWVSSAPGLETCSLRAQLACLPEYINRDLALHVGLTWSGLSAACHQHAFELAPTAEELQVWIHCCEELDTTVVSPPSPADPPT